MRETLFNWLGQDLAGQATLDLYAGTGALSLEALSRGAALAVAVERSKPLLDALAATGDAIGLAGLETHGGEALKWLARETRRFDVIFLDPPFADDPFPDLWPPCIAHLAPGGAIYAEAPRALAPPPGLALHRHGKAGAVHYHLFRLSDPS